MTFISGQLKLSLDPTQTCAFSVGTKQRKHREYSETYTDDTGTSNSIIDYICYYFYDDGAAAAAASTNADDPDKQTKFISHKT